MRWFWVDRFIQFVSGDFAVSIKNVSLAEPHLHGYMPAYPVMPNSLVLEGMAQTGGLLLGETSQFKDRIVLAKVSNVKFHFLSRPGDTLTYAAKLDSVGVEGALIAATSHVGERLQAEVEFYLAILPKDHEADRMFDAANFARFLRLMGIYDVGQDAAGGPLPFPKDLLAAEQADMARTISPSS